MSNTSPTPRFNPLDIVDQLSDLDEAAQADRLRQMELSADQREQVLACLGFVPAAQHFLEDGLTIVRKAWSDAAGQIARPLLGQVGAEFKDYRLKSHLASGAFGEVWTAVDRTLDTPTAIPTCLKLLYPDRSDLDDLMREARTMAAIHHEHVVSVRRADRAELGGQTIPFIEMEAVGEVGDDGTFEPAQSLAVAGVRHDGTPAFTPDQAMEIMTGVCRGVQMAHARGILHRDIKPGNILVKPRSLRAKITDFGIASHTAPLSAERPARGLGTPAYMAPEQARGEATQASDIYALGAVIYFLLAGQAPYGTSTETPEGERWQDVLQLVMSGTPPRPLPQRRGMPRAAAAIVAKAMAADPARRYSSAAELASDLDACRNRRATIAENPNVLTRVRLWGQRNPVIAALLLVLVAGLMVGPAVYVSGIRAEQARTEMQRQSAVAEGQRAVASEQLAIAERRQAEHRLAESYVLRADAYALGGRWLEARAAYLEGAAALTALGLATFPADVGLMEAERYSLVPLLEWPSDKGTPWMVSFAPDGRRFATIHADGVLRVFDAQTGRLQRQMSDGVKPLEALAFSPDGRTVATGGANESLVLWDIDREQVSRRIDGGGDKRLLALAFSPDGRWLASGGGGKTVRLCDPTTGQDKGTIVLKDTIDAIYFFPDSRRIAVSSDGVHIFDVGSRQLLHKVKARDDVLALSADGSRLVVRDERKLVVWNTVDWSIVHQLADAPRSVHFIGPRNDQVVTAGWDNPVRVWDFSKPEPLYTIAAHEGLAVTASVSPDGSRLLTAGFDIQVPVRLWDLTPSPPIRGQALDLSPDGRCVLLYDRDDRLQLVDLDTGLTLATLPDHRVHSGRVKFHGGVGRVVENEGWKLREWDIVAGTPATTRSDKGSMLQVSPDGRFEALQRGPVTNLRDVASGEEFGNLRHKFNARFSDDGSTAVIWSDGVPVLTVFDTAKRVQKGQFHAASSPQIYYLTDVDVSADGRYVVTASGSWGAEVWDAGQGQLIKTLVAPGATTTLVVIAPDGKWVAGYAEDGRIRFWDVGSGREIRSLQVGYHRHGLCRSVDGSRLLVLDGPNVTLFDVARPVRERDLQQRLRVAREALQQRPDDADALAVLGQWYAFRRADAWAVELLERAAEGGAAIPQLELAQAWLRLGRGAEAARALEQAIEKREAAEDYLALCLQAARRMAPDGPASRGTPTDGRRSEK